MTENLKNLIERTLAANLMLPKHGLVTFTWGNASEIDRESGFVAIKPSGVCGVTIDGTLSTPTHLALYRAFPDIGGVVHTYSRWATIFAHSKGTTGQIRTKSVQIPKEKHKPSLCKIPKP